MGDDPRSRACGTIHDHGTAWRVRLLPDLLARPRAQKAARERGPPDGRFRDYERPGGAQLLPGAPRAAWERGASTLSIPVLRSRPFHSPGPAHYRGGMLETIVVVLVVLAAVDTLLLVLLAARPTSS